VHHLADLAALRGRSVTTAAISEFVPLFEQQFGPLTMTVAEFTAGPGARVALVDLVELMPTLAALEG